MSIPSEDLAATTDSWLMPDGVRIWDTPRLSRPHVDMHQQHAPIRVVLVADYQALARLYGEALRLLQVAQIPGADGRDGSPPAIECAQSQVASPLSQVA